MCLLITSAFIGAIIGCAFAFHKLMKSADDWEVSQINGVDDE